LDGSELVLREHKPDQPERVDQDWRDASSKPEQQPSGQSIENVLSDARARLNRLVPSDAYSAVANSGAILVDIRPEAQRATEGSIPGALLVERNVLEWRFDPASSARLAVASGYAVEVIIFCSEGYTSSLAAASLKDLGLWRATDIVGGFKAWQAAGLPTVVFGQPRLTRQEER
jgi:rhodanese-related sulfurtransferase